MDARCSGRQIAQVEGELVEVNADLVREARERQKADERRANQIEEHSAESYEELVKIGMKRGYDNPAHWAGIKWGLRKQKGKRRERKSA